jgi:hypothetical protein
MFKSYLYLVPALLCLLTSCQIQPPAGTIAPAPKTDLTLTNNPNAIAGVTPQVNRDRQMPMDIAVIIDRTRSTGPNKIPDLTEEQLTTIAKALQARGGEFRLLSLCSDSDKVLPHLKLPVPATPPAALAPLPEENTMNALEYAKLQEEREAKVAGYNQQQAAFDRANQAQQLANELAIARFIKDVKPVLGKASTCKATDIVGGIKRVDLYLDERKPAGAIPAREVAFFISDGEHNTTAATKPPEMKSKPEIIVVSPGSGAGMLEQLNPVKFESIDAAIADILSR